MQEKAKFSAAFFTTVKTPETMAQVKAVMAMDRRDRNQRLDTITMLKNGPKTPTIDETAQSRYVK
jgi:hypothetical protein